jgi:hypothetical protein
LNSILNLNLNCRLLKQVARVGCACALFLAAVAQSVSAQQLAPIRESGQTVTPVFEGWYKNQDGTYSLSFGYFNRNSKEVLEIPVGPNNFMSPGPPNRGQPTHFQPRRHWGVFTVVVPPNFAEQNVVWTLVVRGQTFAIPGSLKRGWEIDALAGEAGSGNTPPVLKFEVAGSTGSGPGGITTGPLTIAAGAPLTLNVWATDDGKARSSIASDGREGVRVTLTWFKHQGPGTVSFDDPTPTLTSENKAMTTARFSEPGAYILRVRANDASGVTGAGHAQCCWTNGFVKVNVIR